MKKKKSIIKFATKITVPSKKTGAKAILIGINMQLKIALNMITISHFYFLSSVCIIINLGSGLGIRCGFKISRFFSLI